jgi:hypothetical protein
VKTLALLLPGILLLGFATSVQPQGRYCLTNAETSARLVSQIQRMIAESDSASLANVGLPRVAANQIQLVTNTNTCKKAVAAYRTATGQPSSPTSAYVIRVGTTRLIVIHPSYGAGEFRSHIVLNASNYAYIAWIEG